VVQVDEPSEEKAILMMRGITSPLEKHHRVQILDEAIDAAVRLSHRYKSPPASCRTRQSACSIPPPPASRSASTPCRRRWMIAAAASRRWKPSRRSSVGKEQSASTPPAREVNVAASLATERERLVGLEARWGEEKTMVDKLLALRAQLRDGTAPVDAPADAAPPDRVAILEELKTSAGQTRHPSGREPLILPSVDAQAIAAVVGDWTGIPVAGW